MNLKCIPSYVKYLKEVKIEIILHCNCKNLSISNYENRSLTQLISEIENLRYVLNQNRRNINDGMVMSKILTCLSDNHNYFITAWESTPDVKKCLTNLTNRLLNEEQNGK